jgi:hypothetical protein
VKKGFCCGYCFSPQKGQESERACNGFRHCQQNPRVRPGCGALRLASLSARAARRSESGEPP